MNSALVSEDKPLIWLIGLHGTSDLEFARNLRNANKQYFLASPSNDITPDQHMDWYGSLQSTLIRFYLVMKGTKKIGTISIRYPGTSDDPAEIGNVLIVESERSKGYGSMAMGLAINNIQASGRERIRLTVLPGNNHAINFYKRMGFYEKSLTMEKKV